MDEEPPDIQEILRSVTVSLTDLSAFPNFVHWVCVMVGDRRPDGIDDSSLALAALFEAALRPGSVGTNSRREVAYPMRAARHLLALGDYPEDIRQPIPGVGRSVHDLLNLESDRDGDKEILKSYDPRASGALSLRSRIAAIAAPYGSDRQVLRKNSPSLRKIVDALSEELQKVVADPKAKETLRLRLTVIEQGGQPALQSVDLRVRENSKVVQTFLVELTARLESPPGSYYPPNLGSRRLSSFLRLEPLHSYLDLEQRDPKRDSGNTWHLVGPKISALQLLSDKRRVVVLGDTGSGKSTVGMALLTESIERKNLGVFVRAAELARRAAEVPSANAAEGLVTLVSAFEDWLGEPLEDQVNEYLLLSLREESSLVVIDGVDEIDDPIHQEAFSRVVDLIASAQQRVLLTSRVAGYRRVLSDAEELVVLPLTTEASRSVLVDWFATTGYEKGRVRATEFINRHWTVGTNPLLESPWVSFLGVLLESGRFQE